MDFLISWTHTRFVDTLLITAMPADRALLIVQQLIDANPALVALCQIPVISAIELAAIAAVDTEPGQFLLVGTPSRVVGLANLHQIPVQAWDGSPQDSDDGLDVLRRDLELAVAYLEG